MLTGMVPLSAGAVSVWGHDLSNELGSIRELLGLCPQHDILFPSLTVREHLQLYGRLKVSRPFPFP
jgi:ABC-type multidrug transport system ATPase subunit